MGDNVNYRDYRGVDGVVDDAEKTVATPKRKAQIAVRSNAVTAAQALASERAAKADEGTRSFGAPLGTESERQREAQSTDNSQ